MTPHYGSNHSPSIELDEVSGPNLRSEVLTAAEPPRRAAARPGIKRFIPLFVGAVVLTSWAGWKVASARQPWQWSGTVDARTVSLGSRVGGRVKELLVHEGQWVSKGQSLIAFDPGDLEWKKIVAEAQLEEARAELDKLEKGARPEELAQADSRAQEAGAALRESVVGATPDQRAAAKARLQAAAAELDKRRRDAERARVLLKSGSIAEVQVNEAEAALSIAAAQRDISAHEYEELDRGTRREVVAQAAARADEAAARARLIRAGAREEDLRAERARVRAAEGQLLGAALALDELTVRAPGAGLVQAISVRPGDLMAPNQSAVELLEKDQTYVRIYVPETQLGFVKVGQQVSISVDSFPDRSFAGRVERISGVGEFSPRNLQTVDDRADQMFAARVALREESGELRPGMAAFVRVPR